MWRYGNVINNIIHIQAPKMASITDIVTLCYENCKLIKIFPSIKASSNKQIIRVIQFKNAVFDLNTTLDKYHRSVNHET